MSEVIEDINGFKNYHYVVSRSMDILTNELVTRFRVPAKVISMGLNPSGFPYAFVQVSVNEKVAGKKSAKKIGEGDASIVEE